MRGSDPKILVLIAPVFALVTAVNVITISYAKSLFIANNDYDRLPWMFSPDPKVLGTVVTAS